jgi:SAM-dependent methyltransferase
MDTAQLKDDFYVRWQATRPPLRPAPLVVSGMKRLLNGQRGPGLQLGVTPEIAHLSSHGIAMDLSRKMISLVWPGDCDTHKAINGNWLAMPLQDASMDFAFGDGSLTMLSWPDEVHLLIQNLARVLRPGGFLVLRCFAGPEIAETFEALAQAAFAGEIKGFSAFKLRFNMAAFSAFPNTVNTIGQIHKLFQKNFPDRARLSRATGWPESEIDSIDAYADGQTLLTFPTRTEIAGLFQTGYRHRFIEMQGYELAERCPLLVVDFPAV